MKIKAIKTSSCGMNVYIEGADPLTKNIGVSLQTKKKTENILMVAPFLPTMIEYYFDLSSVTTIDNGTGVFAIVELGESGDILSSEKIRFSKSTNSILITGVPKKILHDFIIVSKNVNGSPVYLFKKLNLGEKCDVCWDEDLGSSNDSNCPACSGTGHKATFAYPIKTYCGPIQAINDTLGVREEGIVSSYSPSYTNIPVLVSLITDDVFYHQNSGVWFIIKSLMDVSSVKGINILQKVAIEQIPTGSPLISTIISQTMFVPNNKKV